MSEILVCPNNPKHTLSADAEPGWYLCYECTQHFYEDALKKEEYEPESE